MASAWDAALDAALAPTGKTGEMELDQFNQMWRSSPVFAEALAAVGAQPGAVIKLSDKQREGVKAFLRQKGMKFEGGMEIDPAGNFNQNEGFGKQAKRWGPILGAAAVTLFGVPGVMPGLLNAGGAAVAGGAAGTAAGTGASAAATGAATGGGMGWLAPTLRYGVPAAGGLVATYLQNKANSKAQDVEMSYMDRALKVAEEQEAYRRAEEQKAIDRALEDQAYRRRFTEEGRDFNRNQYQDYVRGLDPFMQSGYQANSRASAQMGGTPTVASILARGGQSQHVSVGRGQTPAAAAANEPMVTMIAPTGDTKAVPLSKVPHFERLGARRA